MPNIYDKKKNNLKIIAEITNYLQDDLHFDYDDGTFEWFDSTELRIIKPSEFNSKKLYIYHNEPLDKNSIWLRKGLIVELEFKGDKKELLKPLFKEIIFSDGVELKEIRYD